MVYLDAVVHFRQRGGTQSDKPCQHETRMRHRSILLRTSAVLSIHKGGNHVKRLLATMLAIMVVVSMFPVGSLKVAEAAATYFIPDNTDIRRTATYVHNVNPVPSNGLTRDNAYYTNNANLTIAGTFAHVAANSLSVKIEQLNFQSNGTWVEDKDRFTIGTVQEDAATPNRFIAANLALFSGMNKITFSGLQGNLQRSDTFYVVFDRIPYFEQLRVTSGSELVNLNEGSQVVVPNVNVSFEGVAKNASKVTASVNGGAELVTTVFDDGRFFTPAFRLKPGKNSVKLSITNGTNTVNMLRELYYFDPNNPFTDVRLIRASDSNIYQLVDNVPQVTIGEDTVDATPESASLLVQMLVPEQAVPTPFFGTASYSINSTVTRGVYSPSELGAATLAQSEIIIPGEDGVTPAYRLVTFKLQAGFPFPLTNNGTTYDTNQEVDLGVRYGAFNASFEGAFKYYPNETKIEKMWYLPKYNGTDAITADTSKIPLDGAEVESSDFYIMVEGDKAANITALNGRFLPLSATPVTIGGALNPSGLSVSGNQRIYLISGFPNGKQKVEFKLGATANSTFITDISYISKSYINVANLYDGQEIEIDSTAPLNTLTITGKYIGFKTIGTPRFSVNGTDYTTAAFTTSVTSAGNNFSLTLDIDDDGPLIVGENRIRFTGINQISTGNTQDITKELRIYIKDKNLSTIAKFMPTLAVNTRQAFLSENLSTLAGGGYTPTQMSNIFSVTPKFLLKDGAYVTSETSYDLVLRGGGAEIMNVKLGSDIIFTKTNIPLSSTPVLIQNGSFPATNGTTYRYDFAGSQTDFIFRVRDLPFLEPGTQVITLELINKTGARTIQTLEITREVLPYRILSPQPTVGDQIVVNKNFVRFDIEAEGATAVLIEGQQATKRPDMSDRFVYDFVGLKPDKLTAVKIQIQRADSTLNDRIEVFYSSAVQVDSQYMEKIGTKHSVFNKGLQLTFPKGTVLQSASLGTMAPKLYKDTKLLFGIAHSDGVLERVNDYGNIIGFSNDARTTNGASVIEIPERISLRFTDNRNTSNFTRISQIYWINGGVGELGSRGDVGYKPATNGLPPYSIEGNFTEYEVGRKVVPSKRGTLTLGFDGSVVEDVSYTVTVFRYTDRGAWENIGGEVNTKARTIKVPFDEFGYYQVVKLRKGYNDVTNHPWARNILNALYSKGIMKNIRVDEFGANDQTTRGEFATLLVKGLNLPLKTDGNQTFFDITPGTRTATWDYEHVETAARSGIVNGLSEGFFGPDIRITHEDAAVMIAKALQLKMSVNNSKLENNLAKAFVDSGSISYYARPAVEAVNKAKIMTGTPTTIPGQAKPLMSFNPKGFLTRAEAGRIAVALLLKNSSIFPKNLS